MTKSLEIIETCQDNMQDAPYPICCRDECGEHEFCKFCKLASGNATENTELDN